MTQQLVPAGQQGEGTLKCIACKVVDPSGRIHQGHCQAVRGLLLNALKQLLTATAVLQHPLTATAPDLIAANE